MITAQDIREKTFEKSTFGGYAMNEVDDFLDEMANDVMSSQKEIATLRAKMKVLVDKIEEDRNAREDINKVLITAQRTARGIEEESQAKANAILAEAQAKADAILSEAQAKADALLADAQAKSDAVTGNLPTLREAEERRLDAAQKAAAECIQTTSQKLAEALAFLSSIQDADLTNVIVTPAPDERRAIAAPAGEPEAPAEEEPTLAEEAEAAPEEDGAPDYLRAFEAAVSRIDNDVEDAIPAEGDTTVLPDLHF